MGIRSRPRTLFDCLRIGPTLVVTCQRCGRVSRFESGEVYRHFVERGWPLGLDHACQRFVCRKPIGCGARAAALRPSSEPPPEPVAPPPAPLASGRALRRAARMLRG